MDNLADKASAYVKGPGWFPGTERLGDLSKVPEVAQWQRPDITCYLGARPDIFSPLYLLQKRAFRYITVT